MVRNIFLTLVFLSFSFRIFSQNKESFYLDHTIKATATISPGFLLKQSQTTIYINGELEYFPEKRVSLRGDGYWMAGSQQKPAVLDQNHSLFFGGLYHFPKNRFDYFLGFQPGINFTKPGKEFFSEEAPLKVLPMISGFTGVTYYISNYFNFFLNVRYLNGRYYSVSDKPLPVNEIRISAGLGFQVRIKKNSE